MSVPTPTQALPLVASVGPQLPGHYKWWQRWDDNSRGTTIGGSGRIGIHALQLDCSDSSEFTRLKISLQQQFSFTEHTRTVLILGICFFVSSRLTACVREK